MGVAVTYDAFMTPRNLPYKQPFGEYSSLTMQLDLKKKNYKFKIEPVSYNNN